MTSYCVAAEHHLWRNNLHHFKAKYRYRAFLTVSPVLLNKYAKDSSSLPCFDFSCILITFGIIKMIYKYMKYRREYRGSKQKPCKEVEHDCWTLSIVLTSCIVSYVVFKVGEGAWFYMKFKAKVCCAIFKLYPGMTRDCGNYPWFNW